MHAPDDLKSRIVVDVQGNGIVEYKLMQCHIFPICNVFYFSSLFIITNLQWTVNIDRIACTTGKTVKYIIILYCVFFNISNFTLHTQSALVISSIFNFQFLKINAF